MDAGASFPFFRSLERGDGAPGGASGFARPALAEPCDRPHREAGEASAPVGVGAAPPGAPPRLACVVICPAHTHRIRLLSDASRKRPQLARPRLIIIARNIVKLVASA